MKPFQPNEKNPAYAVIAGCTDFAAALAGLLSAQGSQVAIIAGSQESFLKIARSFAGKIFAGDCADMDVLADANIEKARAFVAATGDDNSNLLLAQLAREMFGVRRVIALLNDSERACVYRELGVPAINPALTSAKEAAGELLNRGRDESA